MDKAWTEVHVGSDLAIPRVYRWIIKYVTPLFLLVILAVYLIQDGIPLLKLQNVPAANRVPILMTRVVLLLVFSLLSLMVWLSWSRKATKEDPAG
jgi:hypothetical protein